jgi:hypothetical protein
MKQSYHMSVLGAATLLLLAVAAEPLHAVTLVTNTAGSNLATDVIGQSVTTPTGGPFNNITFNFYDASNNPEAVGDLFILTQGYLGTPAALSSATTGFLAESTGISANHYVFASSVTLQSNTQYFFYADTTFTISGSASNPYAGGQAYATDNPSSPFVAFPPSDVNFTLSGTAVQTPEPATAALGLLVFPLVGFWLHKKRNAATL